MTAPDLKPCPFCGGPASIHKGMQAFDDFEVHCDPCGICGPNFGSMGETLTPKEDAIAAWNTRTDLAEALVELIAAYEDIMDYGIVFAKKDQQDRLNAAKEKFAAIRAIAALPAVPDPAAIREAMSFIAGKLAHDPDSKLFGIPRHHLEAVLKGAAE